MNLGESNNFFRESFRGFNKDDVAEYISKLSKDYAANEERYKEHIAKLTMEVKSKTEELNNFLFEQDTPSSTINTDEIEQKYKEEINRLVNELDEKDFLIADLEIQLQEQKKLQSQPQTVKYAPLESESVKSDISSEEIEKYQETINILSKEIEKLREKNEKVVSEQSEQSLGAVNQLSFQLAECESEKQFLINLLKKFIYTLDIGCARDKNIEYVANISDIAPKAVVSEEISEGLINLIKFKEKAEKLEEENAVIRKILDENQAAVSDEQKMYETITADLGEVIYSAKKSAEDIINKARNEANGILNSAREEATDVVDRATETRESILAKNKENMGTFKEQYTFIKMEHENMMKKYKEITENYMLYMMEVESSVNIIYDTVTDEDFSG